VSRDREIPWSAALPVTAVLAFAWVAARAIIQSITIDEADTYLTFVALDWPSHWYPGANNHVLNSILMRLSTGLLPLGNLSVRIPALIGAAIYIACACRLCRLISSDVRVQWPLLVCLVGNPLVLDFLTAARGYSLAAAFLLCAINVAARAEYPAPERTCVLCSLAAAFSVCANFSFAVINGVLLAAVCAACWRRHSNRPRLLVCCLLPGVMAGILVVGSMPWRFPSSQLVYGATSLRELFHSLAEASLFELNPYVANPLLFKTLRWLRPILLPLLLMLVAGRATILLCRRTTLKGDKSRWLAIRTAVLTGIGLLTVALHYAAFRLFHVLLPKDRTAIWMVLCCTLLAGALMALPGGGRAGEISRRILLGGGYALAIYFLACLRLNYFKEWKFDADVERAYSTLACYSHNHAVCDVPSNWMYASSLNFYRLRSGREPLTGFASTPGKPYPPDKPVYVVNAVEDGAFIRQHRLKIVYRGHLSDIAVVVRPDPDVRPSCPESGRR
jgi:hypothetical protein